jgi:hypothetical protein
MSKKIFNDEFDFNFESENTPGKPFLSQERKRKAAIDEAENGQDEKTAKINKIKGYLSNQSCSILLKNFTNFIFKKKDQVRIKTSLSKVNTLTFFKISILFQSSL